MAAASSFRLCPPSTARFFSLYTPKFPKNILSTFKPPKKHPLLPPFIHYYPHLTQLLKHRCFCSVIAGALSSGEAVEKAKPEFIEKVKLESGEKVRKFRKRVKVSDIKGGADEGLDWLGQKLVVKGWVRTLRVQSSVTFMEVNDGSCLSNLQCVIDSDAEGYDQVESGFITTGAAVWAEGILVRSQGSKQKVELKVAKVITVRKLLPFSSSNILTTRQTALASYFTLNSQ